MADEKKPAKIRVECPHCGAVSSAPAEYAGRRVKCANTACRQSFDVPVPKTTKPKPTWQSAPASNPFTDDDFDTSSAPIASSPISIFSTTTASNPRGVPFNPIQWWRHQPLWLIVSLVAAAFALGLWMVLVAAGFSGAIPTKDGGSTPIWVFCPAILATLAFYTWNTSLKFNSGDANPGLVVSLSPTLIAIPTDLTQGVGSYPAVKIVQINMDSADGKPLAIGTRIPTIAKYAMPHDKRAGHWSDFTPLPVEYATNNSSVLQRILASFSESQYKFLEQALALIERPFEPGLYAMWEAPGKRAGRRIKKGKDF